jgi:adenine-specific DNA-methyltransferase
MNKQEIIHKIKSIEGLSQTERAYLIELVNTKKRYGLVWEDKAENVEELLRQSLPILKEVIEKRIIGSGIRSSGTVIAALQLFEKADENVNTKILAKPNHTLIEGDNLHALTALSFTHEGKFDIIYIDPPYNTGNKDFKYNDSFVDKEDSYRHSKWLSFMHKRLQIAKRLLSDTGVIFISIDDNEQAQLKMLCDEVFLEENFTGELVWEKGKKSDSKFFSITHEYIITYVKSKSFLLQQNVKWRKKKEGLDEVLEKYETLKSSLSNKHDLIKKEMMKWYNALPKDDVRKRHKHYNNSDDRGLYFPDNFAGPDDGRLNRPRYDIIHPLTGKPCAKPSTGWRWDEETTKKALAQTPPRVHFGKDETTIPCRKSYLFEIDSEPFQSVFYKDGRTATLTVEEIVGKGKFNFPKDIEIMCDLIALNGNPNSLILDFFAGSGTTLHATMQLNSSDGGSRQCILVTNNENNICEEVTYARNRKVIEGYSKLNGIEVSGLANNNLRYYKTEFVPSVKSEENKRLLTQSSTDLLCIKEDCYNDITEANGFNKKQCSILTNNTGKYLIVVYHSRQQLQVCDQLVGYIKTLKDISEKIRLYAFSPEKETLSEDFIEVADKIDAVPLPEAIYNAYRATFRAIKLDKKQPVSKTISASEQESESPLFNPNQIEA